MGRASIITLSSLALCGFAANSILCRMALADREIDAASFTALRLLSGALVLATLARLRERATPGRPARGSWLSSMWLVLYAFPFSWAYLRLGAGPGAFILFLAVQLTMLGWGVRHGEPLRPATAAGLGVALGGMLWLTLPGASAPDALGAAAMLTAGVAWGAYSLRGRAAGSDPLVTTAGNFARALVFLPAFLGLGFALGALHLSLRGALLACASGAIASGLGYSVWYAALPHLSATRAAIVQLLVPALAAAAAVVVLDEPLTTRVAGGGGCIVAGVLLTLRARRQP